MSEKKQNPWLIFVKEFKKANPTMTHKEVLHYAKDDYKDWKETNNVVTGGSLRSIGKKLKSTLGKSKTVARKVKNSAKKGLELYDDNADLINEFASDDVKVGLRKAKNVTQRGVDFDLSDELDLTGGKFNMKKFARKTNNTIKKVHKVASKVAPIIALTNPEIGVPLSVALASTGGSFKSRGGSFKSRGGAIESKKIKTIGHVLYLDGLR